MELLNLAWTCTLSCNLSCTHCYAGTKDAVLTEGLSGEDARARIIDPLVRLRGRFLSFTGGEPLLRQDLFDLAEYAKSKGLRTSLVTNGLLLRQHADHLRRGLVDSLQVSLESHREEVNDAVRGAGVHRELVGSVLPWLRREGFPYSIAVTPVEANEQDLEGLAELVCDLGASTLVIRRFLAVGGAVVRDEALFQEPERHKEFLERVLTIRERYRGRMSVKSSVPLFSRVAPELAKYRDARVLGGCTAGIASCAVSIDGTIKICTRVDHPLGNVTVDDLEEVWTSNPDLWLLRNRDRLKGRCGNCRDRWICGGCRGVAFRESGDILGEDAQCWID